MIAVATAREKLDEVPLGTLGLREDNRLPRRGEFGHFAKRYFESRYWISPLANMQIHERATEASMSLAIHHALFSHRVPPI